jgi:uncharacterized lipoprotein YmbA
MISLRAATLAAFVGASSAIIAGCGSSPDPIYFALSPVGTVHSPRATSWAHLVKIRRPAIAGYLDRAEIVSRVTDHRLRVASGESWSEPLGDMVGRILGEDLSDRLPGSVVFTETSPISADPDAVVSVDIQRFDAGEDGALTLRGAIAVQRGRDQSGAVTRNVNLTTHVTTTGTSTLVNAMSDLLGQLADQVARDLVSP